MYKADQLGLVKPEEYRSRYDSIGLDINRLHAKTAEEEHDGESVIVVRDWDTTQLGETALYAAFVQHITGEKIRVHSHGKELNIDELPDVVIPYMSDGEIARRFQSIKGVDMLTEVDQQTVARTALLIKTHFLRFLNGFGEHARDNLKFDEGRSP